MGFRNNLWAIGLASVVTLAGVSVVPASVAAADPTPAPTAVPTATPDPTAVPTATPAPTAVPTATPAPTAVTAATVAAKPNRAARVVRIALAQRGKRYVRGAIGPRAFDCSGLVRYAYRRAGVSSRLGGGHSARGMLRWARIHHRASRSNPQVGDVVIYGNGSHAGIYIGHGRVISALNPRQGIRITRLHALRARFTTYIHTRI